MKKQTDRSDYELQMLQAEAEIIKSIAERHGFSEEAAEIVYRLKLEAFSRGYEAGVKDGREGY